MKRNRSQHHDSEPLFFDEKPEIRSRPDGGEVFFGYWAVFNQRSHVLRTARGKKFVEVIKPGAFDNTDFSDIEARFNHENILAAPPSLRYGVDQKGAWYEIDYDSQDPDHISAYRKVQRGDAKGSSFEFDPPGPNDQNVFDESGIKVREIRSIRKVYEFGPVISPAYPTTSAFVRSLDAEDDAYLEKQEAIQKQKTEVKKFLNKALS